MLPRQRLEEVPPVLALDGAPARQHHRAHQQVEHQAGVSHAGARQDQRGGGRGTGEEGAPGSSPEGREGEGGGGDKSGVEG